MDQLLKPAEAARRYRLNVKTLIKLAEQEQVAAVRVGGQWRFYEPDDEYITPQEAAQIMNVSLPTVYRLLNAREINARRLGGKWRIYKSTF
jgi:excisionase family DNA binding protein